MPVVIAVNKDYLSESIAQQTGTSYDPVRKDAILSEFLVIRAFLVLLVANTMGEMR